MKIFISSTLKNNWNLEFNQKLCNFLEENNISCWLPQRDTDQFAPLPNICNQNLQAISNSDFVIAILPNATVNWGLEVGYAYAEGKPIILLKHKDSKINTMSLNMISKTIVITDNCFNDLFEFFKTVIDKLVGCLECGSRSMHIKGPDFFCSNGHYQPAIDKFKYLEKNGLYS